MNTSAKKILKISLLTLLFIFIVAYTFWTSRDLIFGVKIKNVNLVDGAKMTESVVEVSGNAKNAVHILLNGREIFTDQKRNFQETIALLPGYNIVNIKATDKFGNVDEKNYKLIY